MRVKLTHICNDPKYKGLPGDVRDVPDELAERWIQRGGATAVADDGPAPPKAREPAAKPTAKQPVETAGPPTAAQAKPAATGVGRKTRRGRKTN